MIYMPLIKHVIFAIQTACSAQPCQQIPRQRWERRLLARLDHATLLISKVSEYCHCNSLAITFFTEILLRNDGFNAYV
jgi:hypothetical protein